ncbi:L3 ORF from bp 5376 to 5699; putative [Odocoileus virginianus papillomavirus 1]|uniref:Probable protein L3 n=1 Tax=Odocoileus virginianus papillomavirus 1 TaxID=2772504 RepID=VL3_OVPVD|nr:hypothetical protein DPVgp8 [Deltapapillomavirus 2]P06919.1 RecName: Full=Probable protein L3 [Odocoileus virginianus papillomavirus 1]AAA66847.1 L3 ORF from bp 5376 to 5699; putative [Odocoileus virginianus papillomavirus 1]
MSLRMHYTIQRPTNMSSSRGYRDHRMHLSLTSKMQ